MKENSGCGIDLVGSNGFAQRRERDTGGRININVFATLKESHRPANVVVPDRKHIASTFSQGIKYSTTNGVGWPLIGENRCHNLSSADSGTAAINFDEFTPPSSP